MTTPEDLREIRELMEKATPGEWTVWTPPGSKGGIIRTEYTKGKVRITAYPAVCNCGGQPNSTNAALIVAAINALPALLSAAEQGARAEEALRHIAAPLDCGCRPCRGQCRSAEVLMIELEERQEIARAALPQSPSKESKGSAT